MRFTQDEEYLHKVMCSCTHLNAPFRFYSFITQTASYWFMLLVCYWYILATATSFICWWIYQHGEAVCLFWWRQDSQITSLVGSSTTIWAKLFIYIHVTDSHGNFYKPRSFSIFHNLRWTRAPPRVSKLSVVEFNEKKITDSSRRVLAIDNTFFYPR